MRRLSPSTVLILPSLLGVAACEPDPCTVRDEGGGTYTVSCPDGTSATVSDGMDGTNGMDGTDGVGWIVDSEAEPAGANCPAGGVALTFGPDTDGDGVLDPEEVEATEYVCDGVNGADGAAGADAVPTLVRTDDEPAGANCAAGGIAVHVGTDDDGDGALGDPEIDTTTYVCDGANGASEAFAALRFPTATSSLFNTTSTSPLGAGGGGGIFRQGSYVEQTFSDTGVTSVDALSFAFVMDDRTGSFCPVGTLDFDVKINGTTVGSYSYAGGTRLGAFPVMGELTFPAVEGTGASADDYTLRLESAETVCSGGGSYNWFPGGHFFLRP